MTRDMVSEKRREKRPRRPDNPESPYSKQRGPRTWGASLETAGVSEKSSSPFPFRRWAIMAGRILNRRVLREQTDQAEQSDGVAADGTLVPGRPKRQRKAKALGAPKTKKTRAKKAPPRMRARWGVFDGAMKQVAIFDYNQRAAAEAKLAQLQGKA